MAEKAFPISRDQHPRPDFMRETCMILDGAWQFAFDDADEGLLAAWHRPGHALGGEIIVPCCYQSEASGIGGDEIHPVLWYRRCFTVPEAMQGRRIMLRFGAVDYACQVYVNGRLLKEHVGGYLPFGVDITGALVAGENDLCLRVVDAPDCTQPRGKQNWNRGLMGCWYTPTSGIWQSVYMEAVGELMMERVHVTPDIDRAEAAVSITLDRIPARPLRVEITRTFKGGRARTFMAEVVGRDTRIMLDMQEDGSIDGVYTWSPGNPDLYELDVRLLDENGMVDRVSTYFGMRKIEVREGEILLNNRPYYQRLILDQGYWPNTLLTPPSGEALREDIEWTKRFGYNGARKHQKIEDPRYYYWADVLGLLVWGEVPSAYLFNHDSVDNLCETMSGFIDRDFNHPCIVAWVPLNESWGVNRIYGNRRQQALGRTLYHLCKALDGTRLVSSNDGWEQVTTDICALHDYTPRGDDLANHFSSRTQVETFGSDSRVGYVPEEKPTGNEAFLVTEYGGIAFTNIGIQGELGGMETWGYSEKVTSEEAFLERFAGTTDAIRDIYYCKGYCYTQLTDVLQEVNGLLTPDRRPKVDPEKIAKINRNPESR